MRLFEGTQFDIPPRCDQCGELEEECKCPPPARTWLAPQEQTAKVSVAKRKRGKVVTLVAGLSPEESDVAALLTKLKTLCGAGGTVKEDTLEIQGNHAQKVRECLTEIGYRVRG